MSKTKSGQSDIFIYFYSDNGSVAEKIASYLIQEGDIVELQKPCHESVLCSRSHRQWYGVIVSGCGSPHLVRSAAVSAVPSITLGS